MPNGTAHTAMSSTTHGGAPRRRMRTSVIAQATTMPTRMHSAYPRSGIGPRCQTPWVGLGISASKVTASFTGNNLPPPARPPTGPGAAVTQPESPARALRRQRAGALQRPHELSPVPNAVAPVEPGQVGLDRLHRQVGRAGDLPVGGAADDQAHDATLGLGQPRHVRAVQAA